MKQVTIETVSERIATLEAAQNVFGLGLQAEFELACLRELLPSLKSEDPYAWVISRDKDRNDGRPLFILGDTDPSKVWGVKYMPLFIRSQDDDREGGEA